MDGCVFCKLVSGKIKAKEKFFEDEKVLVMLDQDWATKGHSLVIWKEHEENASELSADDFAHFSEVFRRAELALLDVLKLDRSIVLKSGGLVAHFHFHIYPVPRSTSWQEIKRMFDKAVKYGPKAGEGDKLLERLRKHPSFQSTYSTTTLPR